VNDGEDRLNELLAECGLAGPVWGPAESVG
jgi:hypothetical protein